ncbi:MAG TPA: AsnC family transcriptional regulator, partial [Firmicutes bacterium]|nr:AsnC family transcriptional regulator [Bacillota bacterium]
QDKVKIVYQMTGSTALHVHAFMEDNDSLVDFLQKHVYTIDGITNVEISMLLKRFKSDLTVM